MTKILLVDENVGIHLRQELQEKVKTMYTQLMPNKLETQQL